MMQENISDSFDICVTVADAPVRQLPPEILRMIFISALPPDFLLDSTLILGPGSSWCMSIKMKLSLMRVCRLWNMVGLEMLYEDIVFRWIGQISAFLRTLQENPELGHLVKAVTFQCYIPPGYIHLFDDNVKRILRFCGRITRVNFVSPCDFDFKEDNRSTLLDNSRQVPYIDLCSPLLEVANRLTSLSICMNTPLPDTPLHLGQLTTLRCWTGHDALIQITDWSLPSLQNLTVEEVTTFNISDSFFAIHGHGLLFLNIVPDSVVPGRLYTLYTGTIQAVLDQCPLLQHIALPSLESATSLSHPAVEWIDMWVPEPHVLYPHPSIEDARIDMLNQCTGFPKRRGFRTVDTFFKYCPEIVTMIPPVVLQDFEPFDFIFPGVHVRHDLCRLWKMDMKYVVDHHVDDKVSDASDQTYSFSGSSSSSSSSSVSSSSSSSSHEGLDDEQSWEADNETTLEIYMDLLDRWDRSDTP